MNVELFRALIPSRDREGALPRWSLALGYLATLPPGRGSVLWTINGPRGHAPVQRRRTIVGRDMTIDERLEKLTERHEALTQSVELLRIAQEETDKRFK